MNFAWPTVIRQITVSETGFNGYDEISFLQLTRLAKTDYSMLFWRVMHK